MCNYMDVYSVLEYLYILLMERPLHTSMCMPLVTRVFNFTVPIPFLVRQSKLVREIFLGK